MKETTNFYIKEFVLVGRKHFEFTRKNDLSSVSFGVELNRITEIVTMRNGSPSYHFADTTYSVALKLKKEVTNECIPFVLNKDEYGMALEIEEVKKIVVKCFVNHKAFWENPKWVEGEYSFNNDGDASSFIEMLKADPTFFEDSIRLQ